MRTINQIGMRSSGRYYSHSVHACPGGRCQGNEKVLGTMHNYIPQEKGKRSMSLSRLFAVGLLSMILIGCSSPADSSQPATSQPASSAPSANTSQPSSAPPSANASPTSLPASVVNTQKPPSTAATGNTPQGCPVTMPNGSVPPGESISPLFYGNTVLWTSLWSQGQVKFGPGNPGEIGSDGSLSIRWSWWRGVQGNLVIEGKRLDGTAPPLKAIVPDGFGLIGFQTSTLVFPTDGCWQVTGRVGAPSLTFVTLVVQTK